MTSSLPRRFGPYTLLRRCGQGTRGTLFTGLRNDNPGQLCAVKFLPEEVRRDEVLVHALRAEAESLVRSFHGSVAQVIDVGESADALYMVLEYVAGRDLTQVATDLGQLGRPLDSEVAAFAVMQACSGLSFLGSRGRPGWAATAMLSYDGELKLVDLGATMAALVRPEGPRISFIAPEVARGEAYDVRADVYAAGAMLWQLLAGRVLFAGNDITTVASAASRPNLAEVAPHAPGALVEAAMNALAPDPAARPPTCDDLFATVMAAVSHDALHEAPERLRSFLHDLYGAEQAAEWGEISELAARAGEALRATDQAPRLTTSFLRTISAEQEAERAERETAPEQVVSLGLDTSGGELPIGQLIPGTRYRVLSKLGSGGMGTVYLAEHVDIERKVALKLLSPLLVNDAESLARFRFEARTASRIGHPNIVEITDFGEAPGGRFFFVMEYLQGETLGAVLRRDERVAPDRAVGILRQVCKALGAAHGKGIVHCDVKPDNIILVSLKAQEERRGHRQRADFVKVLDFGIAAMLGRSQTGTDGEAAAVVAGTAEYMSPERARGLDFDGRADVYALGAVAYEMLTGDVPFHGATLTATLTAHLKDPPEPPEQRAPEARIPASLSRWVLAALGKDPSSRPATCAELEAALCEAQVEAKLRTDWDHLELPEEIDPARRSRLAARMPSATKSRRGLWVAAIAFAILSLGLAAFLMIQKPRFIFVNEESQEVRLLLDQASAAAAAGRFSRPKGESALDYLERVKKLSPKSRRARALREGTARILKGGADRLWDAGLRRAARDMYREAFLFTPWDTQLRERAALALASEASQPASARAPGDRDAEWLATQAELALLEGRFTGPRGALHYLRQLARLDPEGRLRRQIALNLGPELRARADRYWRAGAIDKARALYRVLATLDPDDPLVRARAAGQPRSETPPPRPVKAPAVDAGPDEAALAALATERERQRQRERERAEARRRALEEARRLAPPDPEAQRDPTASRKLSEEGRRAFGQGRLGDAERSFQQAVRADPRNPTAVFGLAEVRFERARYAESLDYCRRAVRLRPRAARYRVLCGDAYYKLLRYEDALTSWRKALELRPGSASVQRRINRLEKKLGK